MVLSFWNKISFIISIVIFIFDPRNRKQNAAREENWKRREDRWKIFRSENLLIQPEFKDILLNFYWKSIFSKRWSSSCNQWKFNSKWHVKMILRKSLDDVLVLLNFTSLGMIKNARTSIKIFVLRHEPSWQPQTKGISPKIGFYSSLFKYDNIWVLVTKWNILFLYSTFGLVWNTFFTSSWSLRMRSPLTIFVNLLFKPKHLCFHVHFNFSSKKKRLQPAKRARPLEVERKFSFFSKICQAHFLRGGGEKSTFPGFLSGKKCQSWLIWSGWIKSWSGERTGQVCVGKV